MSTHSVIIRLIVKSDSPADAELYVRTKLQPKLAEWFDEPKHDDASHNPPYWPEGALMHYAIARTQINVSDEPKPECTCREGAKGADPNCYRHSVEKFDGLS